MVFFACIALFARHFFDGTGWSVPRGYAAYKPICVKLFMNVYLSPAHALISNLVVMHFYGYLSMYLLDVYVYIVCYWLCSMDLAGILFRWGGLVFWALWFICSIILGREMVLLRCPYWYRTKGLLSCAISIILSLSSLMVSCLSQLCIWLKKDNAAMVCLGFPCFIGEVWRKECPLGINLKIRRNVRFPRKAVWVWDRPNFLFGIVFVL